ncbi:MAG: hypothetical protein VB071_01765 [Lawsonibacter sp.]|nr:hypothetical protein [Lawsonibacter sp.]
MKYYIKNFKLRKEKETEERICQNFGHFLVKGGKGWYNIHTIRMAIIPWFLPFFLSHFGQQKKCRIPQKTQSVADGMDVLLCGKTGSAINVKPEKRGREG